MSSFHPPRYDSKQNRRCYTNDCDYAKIENCYHFMCKENNNPKRPSFGQNNTTPFLPTLHFL